MRIAVASKSGTAVDQHFGHAERFLIYEYAQGRAEQVDEVRVEKYCSFDPEHPFRHRQFDAIVAALDGCRAVVTAMIGPLPKQELQKAGIEAVSTEGPIEEALRFVHSALCGCGGQGPKKCSSD
jgi:predicted Fe-Mo cluster-binding NifX family protein